MKRTLVVASVMALAIITGSQGLAVAQENTPECGTAISQLVDAKNDLNSAQKAFDALEDRIPNSKENIDKLTTAVTDAKAALAVALPPVTDLNPQVYDPPGKPTVEQLTPAFLQAILDKNDEQLGGSGRDLINAALAAHAKVAETEKALADGQTVPNPELKDSEELDNLNAAKDAVAKAQAEVNKLCKNPPTTDTPVPPLPVADDQDCDDFATQADAQNHLNADTTDPDNLDSDNDGEACEAFFAPAQIPAPPVGGVETGDGSTA